MIEKINKVRSELKTRILLNKLENYENLMNYYLEEAERALDEDSPIMYAYWTDKAARCVDEYRNVVRDFAMNKG